MNIYSLFLQHARENPERIALDTGKAVCTYGELESNATRVASMFAFHGLQPGDRVLIFQPMSIELYEVLLAIFKSGLVAVFADPQSGRKHIRDCCIRGRPMGFVGPPKAHWLRLSSWALWRIPFKFTTKGKVFGAKSWARLDQFRSQGEVFDVSVRAPALITFTSGSTGKPKAAVRTHAFLIAQNNALKNSIKLLSGQIDMATLPIFVLSNLAAGVTSIVPDVDISRPGFIKAAPVVKQIQKHGVDRSAASPAFYQRLVDYCVKHDVTLDSIKQVYTGGAPVFPSLLKSMQDVMPEADVVAVYGSTEAEPIAHISLKDISGADFHDMNAGRGLLSGVSVDEINLAIVDIGCFDIDAKVEAVQSFTEKEFKRMQVPLLESGEVVLSGAHVLPGYLDGEGDATTKFEVDGVRWHRTGDAAYLDGQERLWLLGRCNARIEDSKGVLYPFTVECAAMQCEGVVRAALVSFKGERLLLLQLNGEQRAGIDSLSHLFEWAELDEVRFVKNIPVDLRHNAKVNYPELLDRLKNQNLK